MATPREEREYAELSLVSALGVRASGAGDRETPEEPCPLRTCFQRDVDRITHCTMGNSRTIVSTSESQLPRTQRMSDFMELRMAAVSSVEYSLGRALRAPW